MNGQGGWRADGLGMVLGGREGGREAAAHVRMEWDCYSEHRRSLEARRRRGRLTRETGLNASEAGQEKIKIKGIDICLCNSRYVIYQNVLFL